MQWVKCYVWELKNTNEEKDLRKWWIDYVKEDIARSEVNSLIMSDRTERKDKTYWYHF